MIGSVVTKRDSEPAVVASGEWFVEGVADVYQASGPLICVSVGDAANEIDR